MSPVYIAFSLLNGLVFLLMGVWFLAALHMAYTRADEILSYLKNSPAARNAAFYRHLGPWGMLRLIGAISSCVAFPRWNIKQGNLSEEDMDNLPVPLQRKLAFLYKSLLVLFSLMALLAGLYKIVGWSK